MNNGSNPHIAKNFALVLIGLLIPSLFLCYQISLHDIYFDTEFAKIVDKLSWQWAWSENDNWYLWVNFGVIIFPFLLSFDKKVAFYRRWKYLFPAICFNAAFFIAWDVYYTHLGVWGFNERYFQNTYLGLPAGEWLFFINVPYACVFVHQCLRDYFPKDMFYNWDAVISWGLIIIFFGVGVYCYDKIYTAWAFLLSGGALLAHYLFVKNTFRTHFYRAYLVCLIPFLITNGILTGSVNQEPIVIYNDTHNLTSLLNARIITIPFDDLAYGFLLLFVPIFIYEELQQKPE